jgi:hypothetical protein
MPARFSEKPEQAGEWRRRAERLRALAQTTNEPAARAELLDLAKQWEGLANVAERAPRRSPRM